MIPDLSSIPIAIGPQADMEIPSGPEIIKDFEATNFPGLKPPQFKNLHITLRFSNGYHSVHDSDFPHMLGCPSELEDILEVEGEDMEGEPLLSVFCTGIENNQIETEPCILRHLLLQLCRTQKTISSDITIARFNYTLGVCGYTDGDEGDREAQAFRDYPDWLKPIARVMLPLGGIMVDSNSAPSRGEELYRLLKSAWEDSEEHKQLRLAFTEKQDEKRYRKHIDAITRAVDRIIEAEKPIIYDGTDYFNPDDGLFHFGGAGIHHDTDVSYAAEEYLRENFEIENPLNDLVTVVSNQDQLEIAMNYLRSVDDLYELCKQLP